VPEGATRFYAVTAINSIGEGVRSNEASATTTTRPTAPQVAVVTAGPNPGQLTVSWQAPANDGGTAVTSYRVYRGTTAGALTAITDVVAPTLTFTDSALGNNVTRIYAVTAINAIGEGPRSNQATGTTFTLPSAPAAPVATGGPGAGQITVSWTAPATNGGTAITGYRVYRGTATGALTALTDVNATSFTDTALGNGVRRFYAVSALNAVGEGGRSVEVNATTFVPPSAPNNLNVRPGPGNGQIGLTWTAPANTGGSPISTYRVYAGSASGQLTPLADVAGSTLTFTESGLGNGVTRFYTVSALNPAGESPQSGQQSARTFKAPGNPLNPIGNRGPGKGQATLSWAAPSDTGGTTITGFRVFAGSSSTALNAIADLPATSDSFTDSNLGNGTNRFFAVSAINSVGESPRSAVVSTTTFDQPGKPATTAAAAGPANGELTASWTPPTDDGGMPVTSYTIYKGTTATNLVKVASVPASADNYVDTALAEGVTRFYAVAAVNDIGEGVRSAPVSATTFTRPGSPTAVTATAGPGVGQIRVTWTTPANTGGRPITQYNVYRQAGNALQPAGTVAAPATTFTDSGLGEGEQVTYVVTATNGVGESALSTSAIATTWARPTVPQNVTQTAGPGLRQITISWKAPASDGGRPVSAYRIYWDGGSGTFTKLAEVAGTARTWTDSNRNLINKSRYIVTAVNLVGEGPASAPTCGSAFPSLPPPVDCMLPL